MLSKLRAATLFGLFLTMLWARIAKGFHQLLATDLRPVIDNYNKMMSRAP